MKTISIQNNINECEELSELKKLLIKAIEICGSQSELARRCGVNQASVWFWLHRNKSLSPTAAIAIEKATNKKISRKKLLPDFDW